MFGAIFRFTRHSKREKFSPDECYAAIILCFISQFHKEDRQLLRDIIEAGTNRALGAIQE